jgi:hypothetical protein
LALPFYPPEFHKYTKLAHANPKHTKSPSITKEFDLYQLGQILWILAESWATGESAQKLKESFHKNSETFQGESFSRRSAFPRLSQNIPDYFRLMVEESCAESPYARPRAVDLLSRFPSTCFDIISVKQKNQSSQVIDVKTLLKCRVRSVLCSICHAHITSITYRCIICVGGDFDLCQHCFDKRRHCNDHSHLLGEILVDIIPSDVTRYHSSVDSLGARHITEL